MATRKWDAYRTLGMTTRNSPGASCFGTTRFGKRCRWDIGHRDYEEVVGLLNAMELQPPEKAYDSLNELAELSLCEDFHQHQASQVVRNWKSAVGDAAKEYGEVAELTKKIRLLENRLKSSNVPELEAEIERIRSVLVDHKSELEVFTKELQDTVRASAHRGRQAEKYHLASLNAEARIITLQQKMDAFQLHMKKESDGKMSLGMEVADLKEKLKLKGQECGIIRDDLETDRTAFRDEKHKLESQIEHDLRKYQDTMTELREIKAKEIRHAADAEILRTQLASEKNLSTELRQELVKTKEALSSAGVNLIQTRDDLTQTRTDLALLHTDHEELKSSSANKQMAASLLITSLTDQITFIQTHPFRTFFLAVFAANLGWAHRMLGKVNRVWNVWGVARRALLRNAVTAQ